MSNIGFVFWGVRNGFEIILASKPLDAEFLRADVITDNMRQVCNVSPKRFYSIHRNDRFAAATLYHTDAKDVVGRTAYIAITLYLPITHRFVGNVSGTLNTLMDFYFAKQGNANVNMFTEEMVLNQYHNLSDMPIEGRPSHGSKSGYLTYQTETDISDRLEQLNIDGYKAVYFLPPGNEAATQQLLGFEPVTAFVKTCRVSLEGYDHRRYTVFQNNQIVDGTSDILHIDGSYGEFIIISENSTGRQKKVHFNHQPITYQIRNLFPEPSRTTVRKEPSQAKLILIAAGAVVILLLGIWGYFEYTGGGDEKGNVKVKDSTSNPPRVNSDETNDTKTSLNSTLLLNELIGIDTTGLSKNKKKILADLIKIKGIESVEFSSNNDSLKLVLQIDYTDSLDQVQDKITTSIKKNLKESVAPKPDPKPKPKPDPKPKPKPAPKKHGEDF